MAAVALGEAPVKRETDLVEPLGLKLAQLTPELCTQYELGEDVECLLGVKTPRSLADLETSGPRGRPDENDTIPDIRARRSGAGGIPDVLATWPERPDVAISRH